MIFSNFKFSLLNLTEVTHTFYIIFIHFKLFENEKKYVGL